ncbi:MAG: hypothetical protein VW397_07285 [Candidatus Margulisiibacteriota bacterium]
MVNINTSGAQSGRDFTYGASPIFPISFIELYNDIIRSLELIALISDEHSIKIEISKLRKKVSKLITDHFNPSISQLKAIEQFNPIINNEEEKLKHVIKELALL